MDLAYVREFSVLAKYRNLSEASNELYTTQPVLSKHLAALEKEIGAELLDRSESPMQLTPAGEVFLEESCGLLAKYYRMLDRTRSAKTGGGVTETIQLSGMFNSAVLGYCAKAEQEFLNRFHTTVHAKQKSYAFNTAKNLIKEGSVDIAFEIFSRAMDVPGIESQPLYKDSAVVVVEKGHRLSSRDVVRFEELEDETHVTLNSNEDYSLREYCREMCEKYHFEGGLPYNFAFKNVLTYQQLLLQGLDGGILVLPSSSVDFFPVFSIERYSIIPIVNDDVVFDMRAFYSETCPKKVRLYLKCLEAVCQKNNKGSVEP